MKKLIYASISMLFLVSCGNENVLTKNISTDSLNTKKASEDRDSQIEKVEGERNFYKTYDNTIAWEFDYPLGNKGIDSNGNKISFDEGILEKRNKPYNLDKNINSEHERSGSTSSGWYNLSDVGNFVWENGWAFTGGLHPGEDWNHKNGDAGKEVYAIANGKVVYLKTTYSGTTDYGWTIVLEHKLPDNSKVYSIYTHITNDYNNDDGDITTNKNDFTYTKNSRVYKGNTIGRIADKSSADHLHFEIRNKINLNDLYPNDNGHGYYSHNKSIIYKKSITKENVKKAFKLMREDGILDPSDFIDDHRNIYPWIGNGSIISYHGANAGGHGILNITSDAEYPYGITKDITKTHTQLNNISTLFNQSGFYQWQPNSSCERIKISHAGYNNNIDITIGSWNTRDGDKTYENVTLPFVLGEDNFKNNGSDWRVIAVTFNDNTINSTTSNSDVANTLEASCTDEPLSSFNGVITKNKKIMIGEHQWNGNASIISRTFKQGYVDYYNTGRYQSYADNWAFGAFHDVTKVHKNQYKPVVFFQWMSSDICNEIVIDAPSLSDSEKSVSLVYKPWNGASEIGQSSKLPITISSDGRLWTVLKVAFDKPVSKDARVTATCKNLN